MIGVESLVESLIKHIQNKEELDPDKHDGSYELVRETAKAFKNVSKEQLDYKDMNLLYFMTVGTFTKVSSFENKKRRIEESNLKHSDKERLKALLDRVMKDAQQGKYKNSMDQGSIGMFGSGFSSFAKYDAENEAYANFIIICIEILDEEDEEVIFDKVENVIKKPIRGLGIAGASQILHCLKPFIFPILNKGEGYGIDVYKKLGVNLIQPEKTTNYVKNTRIIRDFRNKYFPFKNYRVIDISLKDYNDVEIDLEKPFSNIFNDKEEANWAFDFIAETAESLGLNKPSDPRIAMSLRRSGKAIHFIYCNWLIVGFHKNKGKQTVILPLLKESALKYEKYFDEDFSTRYNEESIALYVLPFNDVKNIDEELSYVFENTLARIHQRFQHYKRSPFRERPSHVPELVEMVFDYEKRDIILKEGLGPHTKIMPNIWWVNQGKNIEKEKEGGLIWAPLKNKAGHSVSHWDTLAEVEKGDITLHYSKGELRYVSRVTKTAEKASHPSSNELNEHREGRLVRTEYHELSPTIPLPKFNSKLQKINIPRGPLDNTGGIKEGYLYYFNEDALNIIQGVQSETEWPEFTLIYGTDTKRPINPVYTKEQLIQDTFLQEEDIMRFVKAINRKGQAIIYGPPGTGKTYIAEKIASHLLSGCDGFYKIIQFHPAYTYEDFVQGLRPQIRDDNLLEYKLLPGRFMEFCERSKQTESTCLLIIDEINRANLSRVLGELMYLLEYRDKEIPLASGETLRIPENARIIGTMNTADRSIALVDYALRRRFAFFALRPNYDVLRHFHEQRGISINGLITVLRQLNAEIGDPHYEVGHSFFLIDNLFDHLEDIWEMEILPYLEEYFFDQPDKALAFSWENMRDKLVL